MTLTLALEMIAADILKLRRNRATMLTAVLLSVGIAVLYFTFILLRHNGNLAGPLALSDGGTLMGVYFGAFAAILIGAEMGTIDVTNGVFRDLVATGRSRTALFLVRIPAAVAVALPLTLVGFALSTIAAFAFHGSAAAPSGGQALEYTGSVALDTIIQTTLAVSVASLTRSRSITLVAIIGWNTIATALIHFATFLGSARDLVLLIALGRLTPGPAVGTHANPGSSIALDNFKLAMPASVAVLVILAWAVIPAAAGTWRTKIQDA
jgi:hypothetical protein